MERLTTNKDVSEMSMIELAYNSCYAKNGKVRFRDFENDFDARELTRNLLENLADDAFFDNTDETFDRIITDYLQYGTNELVGLIALFYRNLLAMADLRERLKEYEDLEERGLLLKLPCRVGDKVYRVHKRTKLSPDRVYECRVVGIKQEYNTLSIKLYANINEKNYSIWIDDWFDKCQMGNEFFLTQKEAEEALRKMNGAEGER